MRVNAEERQRAEGRLGLEADPGRSESRRARAPGGYQADGVAARHHEIRLVQVVELIEGRSLQRHVRGVRGGLEKDDVRVRCGGLARDCRRVAGSEPDVVREQPDRRPPRAR